ncbi:MAG: class I SAM-dependent methyltransferase [Candidatus Bathyarchaeota archaeon]|nr:class I SAM-dependent methyltransferase [Candidatus Termiticorpusculum sp.]
MPKTKWNYDTIANFYQSIAHIYSFGQIRRSKNLQLSEISKGTKVLYVGCGSGEDAVQAAKKGANVTCIDISSKMIKNTKIKLNREKLTARLICGDIFDHLERECYDVVTANYFLNNFPADVLPKLFSHILALIKPGGKIMIADFYALSKNRLIMAIQRFNFYIVNFFFWALRFAPLHKYQDYTAYFDEREITLERVDTVRLLNVGVPFYSNTIGIKQQPKKFD